MPSARVAATLSIIWISSVASAATAPPHTTEIRVSLFGSPCVLEGPVEEATLRNIHSVSPEQIYPALSLSGSVEQAKRALDKVRTTPGIPSSLDHYRERLSKRIEAQLAFLEGIQSARKTRSTTLLLKLTKPYILSRSQKTFEESARKLESKEIIGDNLKDLIEQLFDTYGEGIEPDPEEEFHRAIKRLNIQYVCSFEEDGGTQGK